MHDPGGELFVAEFQGLYGAFSFSERLLQKVWLRGDFDRTAAVLADGRRLRILHPGRWNQLGGPDFAEARLRFGGEEVPETVGDVEVHLRAVDWEAHGHARDPAYNRVVLHVVLFPPAPGHTTRGAGGREIPVLAVLPLLHRALEEFAADEAVELLADHAMSRLLDELGRFRPDELESLLRRPAELRWHQKIHFARLRLERLGWETACHHTALEILGFRFNRAPMLRLAGEFPLGRWVDGTAEPEELFAREKEGWSLQGVRPANHPRQRLRQYAAWVAVQPDWPARVRRLGHILPAVDPAANTGAERRRLGFAGWRELLTGEVCAHAVKGTRFDNLLCDGVLPLLAAGGAGEVRGWWHHWFPGDLPRNLTADLRRLGVFDGRGRPACHGVAQGLLGWMIERERTHARGGQSGEGPPSA